MNNVCCSRQDIYDYCNKGRKCEVRSTDSDSIEFTRQAGNTLSFVNIDVPVKYGKSGNTYTQSATNDGSVSGDNRDIEYSISPTGAGASVDLVSGKVDFTLKAIGNTFIITATKAESAKYEAQTAEYQLTVQANTNTSGITKPAVRKRSEKWGTPITFLKVAGHTYALKKDVSGVSLDVSNKNTGEVRSTEVASGVIVVATKDGNTEESDPIEFFTR